MVTVKCLRKCYVIDTLLSVKRIICISIELIPYSLWVYVCQPTDVELHIETSQKCTQKTLLQILKVPLVKDVGLQQEFNANVALYRCRWYDKHFSDLSTSVIVQPTSYQMICCVSKLRLTNAVQVGLHDVITNLNSLFLLKTELIITDFVLLCYAYSVDNRMTCDSKCLYCTFKSLPYAVCLILYILIHIQPRFRMFLGRHRLT